ncbi:MAG: hypothetical protein AB1515_00675 [Nitrospirota bacterium]
MISLDQVQTRLAGLQCPICKQSAFFVHPRAEESFAEQFYKARCNHCGYMFQVSVPTKPIHLADPDTAQWLAELPCPVCQAAGARADFRCIPTVRESLYFVTCTHCHSPFQERAPMEAFE